MTSPWPYGTRRKSGTPDEFNIGVDLVEQMLSPIPNAWIAAIIGTFDPTMQNTDALCADPPPLAETWGISDVLAHFDPATATFTNQKLIRMVRAAVWPTYCEYTPAPPDSPDFLNPAQVGSPRTIEINTGMIPTFSNTAYEYPGVDFYVFVTECIESPTDGAIPYLSPWPGDETYPWGDSEVASFSDHEDAVPALLDVTRVSTAVIGGYYPIHHVYKDWPTNEVLASQIFTPASSWRAFPPSSGRWLIHITAWTLQGPPRVEPWPYAPSTPTAFQFSEECAYMLCQLASWFPNLKLNVEDTTVHVNELLARGSDERIQQILDNSTLILGGTTDLVGAAGGTNPRFITAAIPIAEGEIMSIDGTIGVIVEFEPGDSPWKVQYGTPERFIRLGRVTYGSADAWKPPVDLVVSPQLVSGWPINTVSRLAVSLFPGSTATVRKIFPGGLP